MAGDRLNSSQDEKFKDVEISVIPVKYVGEYLAIGVHYKYQRDDEDVSGYIEEKIKEYLETTSAFEFLSFCFKQEKSWFDVRQEHSIEARSKKERFKKVNEKVTLNLIHQAQCIGKIDLLLDSLAYNKCCISLLSSLDGCKDKYENLDFFSALVDLRMDLEKKNWFVACYGSLNSVYPSGMSADMTRGTVAYDYSIPEKASSKNQVYIFDPITEDKYQFLVTVEKQRKTREDYFRIKKERWLRENSKKTE